MAVLDNRQARWERGKIIDDVAPWSPDELVLATHVRLPLVKGALCAFKTGMVKLNRLLWPSARTPAAPDTTTDIVNMLKAAPRCIGALLDSAVRAGAQTTLATLVSWCPTLDLNLLAGMHEMDDLIVGKLSWSHPAASS